MQSQELFSATAAATALSPHVTSDRDLSCAFYCEENVWRLAYRKLHLKTKRQDKTEEQYFVAFISNASKNVPMFHQRASVSPEDTPCCWDYHVILIGVVSSNKNKRNTKQAAAVVYDLDTTLTPYPVPLSEYLDQSFSDDRRPLFLSCAPPLFRLIPAETYLRYFASDRSHMYNATTKRWNAPPPPYSCILVPATNNTRVGNRGDDGDAKAPPCAAVDGDESNGGGSSQLSFYEQHHTIRNPATTVTDDAPVASAMSNLHHYLNFGPAAIIEEGTGISAQALGSILTLQQLRSHVFS